MIESSESRFDYVSFEKKLKHYFSDTAPCIVRYSLGLSDIKVERDVGDKTLHVSVSFEEGLGVSDQICRIVRACEETLYPVFKKVTKQVSDLTLEEKEKLIARGVNPYRAMGSRRLETSVEKLYLTRVSFGSNHLVLRNEDGARFLYKLRYIPLQVFMDKFVFSGELSEEESYDKLMSYVPEVRAIGE